MGNTTIDDIWTAVCDLAQAHGAAPLNKHAGCWCLSLDDRWYIALNAHNERMAAPYPDRSQAADVPPFSMFVVFNGWPFAIIDPYKGQFGHGDIANIDTFHRAILDATERKRHPV